jgi:sugar O-acyltransferase (sialic acid O-acetyltransferase NeuD family)
MSVPEPIVIVGVGGFSREVLDVIAAINTIGPRWDVRGIVGDGVGADLDERAQRGEELLGPIEALVDLQARYVIGIGDPGDRQRIDRWATGAGLEPASVVHPTATVGSDDRLGPGVVIASGARITTNIEVGRHVHLDVNSTVSHDCVIGRWVTLGPAVNVTGHVTIGDRVSMGARSVVIPGITVGDDVTVGAGAVVVRDLAAGVTAVGSPARPLGP